MIKNKAVVVNQICVKEQTYVDGDAEFTLERGKEYTTSIPRDDRDVVKVFSSYWFMAPKSLFAGAMHLDGSPLEE